MVQTLCDESLSNPILQNLKSSEILKLIFLPNSATKTNFVKILFKDRKMSQTDAKVSICIFRGKTKRKKYSKMSVIQISLNVLKAVSQQDFKDMILGKMPGN